MSSRAEHSELLSSTVSVLVSEAHIFTSDSIILADFSKPRKKDACCDLGTGCGIIPLLWYRDVSPARITAAEISDTAVELFTRTLKNNGLTEKIELVHCDIREFKGVLQGNSYNVVSMNPPYKRQGTGKVNSESDYKNARHEYTCTLDDAARAASYLLKFSGKFCICQRPERLADIFEAMRKNKIEPKVLREVIQRRGKGASLVLVEGRKCGSPGLKILAPLYIENETGGYSDEADKLFNSYKSK